MIRETTEAKVEFHEQYWSKISNEGALFTALVDIRLNHNSAKTFIKALLNPDPSQRPTAQQALNSHVSGVHYPSSALTSLTIPIVVDDSQSLYRT
jgi:calcium/calmodulin-dependent protein kinase I